MRQTDRQTDRRRQTDGGQRQRREEKRREEKRREEKRREEKRREEMRLKPREEFFSTN